MRKAILIIVGVALAMGVAFAQNDPWWDPRNPFSQSEGVSYGTTAPTDLLTDGILWVQITAGAPPALMIYDQSTTSWIAAGGAAFTVGTAATLPMWNGVPDDLVDSSLTDDGTDVLASGGLFTVGTVLAGAESILIDGTASGIVFEGATANGFETTLTVVDPTGINTITLPDNTGSVFLDTGLTNNRIPLMTAVAGILEDSLLSDDGTNVTLTSGQLLLPDGTAALPSLSNTGDPNTGWWFSAADTLASSAGGEQITAWTNLDTAGVGGDIWTFTEDLPILDGSNGGSPDTINGLVIDITNANHTDAGDGNRVNLLTINGITGDAQAKETALYIEDGADWDMRFETSTEIGLGTSGEFRLRSAPLTTNDQVFTFSASPWVGPGSADALRLGGTANLAAMNGSDTKNIFYADIVNGNHTGAGTELNAFAADAITGDAEALEYGVHIKTGWDAAFYHEGIAFANLQATANGSIVFCTNCDPASTPCTSAGAATGAFAFRVNGQWDCPW